jgi:hypothetical protein
MARTKKQFIINYHTSGTSNPSTQDVMFGEIVVKHNAENPELLVKVNDNGTEKFAKFIDETAVEGKVTANTATIASNLQQLSGAVVSDYATSANTNSAISALSGNVESAIATAKSEAINTASGYTDEQISTLSTNLGGRIDSNDSDIEKLQSSANTLNNKFGDYATSADTHSAIGAAKDAAVESATTASSAYTDAQIAAVSGASSAYTDAQISSAFTGIEANRSNIQSLSGAIGSFSADVETTINSKIASAYFVKGSKSTYNDLPDSGNVVGDVWNVINAVEINGEFYPAGTNWVYTSDGWDALGGTIDLSPYQTTAATETMRANLENAISSANTKIEALQSSAATLDGKFGDYATSANTHAAIATAKSEAINAASGASSAYTDAQISSFETSKLDPVKSRVQALEAISGATQSAVQTVVFSGATAEAQTASASGAKVAKVGTEIQLDLSELVIDGGEY